MTTALVDLGRGKERHALNSALENTSAPSRTTRCDIFEYEPRHNSKGGGSTPEMLIACEPPRFRAAGQIMTWWTFIRAGASALARSCMGQFDAAGRHMNESQRLTMGGQVVYGDWVAAFSAEIAFHGATWHKLPNWHGRQSISAGLAAGTRGEEHAANRGLALAQMGPPFSTQALEHVKASLAAFEACEALLERARARVILANLLQKSGESTAALSNWNKRQRSSRQWGWRREINSRCF